MGGRAGYEDAVPAEPFVRWIRGELDRLVQLDEGAANGKGAAVTLATALRVNERTVYRWKNSYGSESDEVVTEYSRRSVEDALLLADVTFDDLYPEVVAAEDFELEADAYCSSCRDVVSPIGGVCPWCERTVTSKLPERLYCKREDRMMYQAQDGTCWRCGGQLAKHIPVGKCECGCDGLLPRFNERGRRIKFIRGHAPRSHERSISVPIGPFAEWMAQQLRDLDPVQALARRVGLSRDAVLDVLARRDDEVNRETVRDSLHRAACEGQTFGLPPRPGSVVFADLYPEWVRSRKCPECGAEKAASSKLCATCRQANPTRTRQNRESSITPEMAEEARRLYEEGRTFTEIAKHFQPRTRCTTLRGVMYALTKEFRRRGWETPGRGWRGKVAA